MRERTLDNRMFEIAIVQKFERVHMVGAYALPNLITYIIQKLSIEC